MRSLALIIPILLAACGQDPATTYTVDYSHCEMDNRCDSNIDACSVLVDYDAAGNCFVEVVPSDDHPNS